MLSEGQKSYVVLEDRGVVSLRGDDARSFLQGLTTNDIGRVTPDQAIWTGLLTPQGKYLFDFFVAEMMGALVLDVERARVDELLALLARYKLRAKVDIVDDSADWVVVALMGSEADGPALAGFEGRGGLFAGGICFVDPRYGGGGARVIMPREVLKNLDDEGFERGEAEDYDLHRLTCGLPDGSRDLVVEKSFPMEHGFDALNGIAWEKGCYVGQEMTARMRYRANMKRTLLPVEIEGAAPAPGSAITQNGKDAGEMRSSRDGIGLALLRIEALEKFAGPDGTLTCGEARLTPMRPPWLAPGGGETVN
jgi:folate-binding protein YgfZ